MVKPFFMNRQRSMCVCVCVCVWKRERERERERQAGHGRENSIQEVCIFLVVDDPLAVTSTELREEQVKAQNLHFLTSFRNFNYVEFCTIWLILTNI